MDVEVAVIRLRQFAHRYLNGIGLLQAHFFIGRWPEIRDDDAGTLAKNQRHPGAGT
jgi:hypothetical protein